MNAQKDKYKEATAFFGAERMAQLEHAIKEQSIKTSKIRSKKTFARNIKMAGVLMLVGYSAGLTCLMLQKSKATSAPLIINNAVVSPNNSQAVARPHLPESSVVIEKPNPLVKVKVKKGDSLSSIAQNILKSNGAKNTFENRKMVIEQLKSKNELIQNDQSIKSGWTLLSLSKSETLEICKN